jgi:type I restriction enzyme S subunit
MNIHVASLGDLVEPVKTWNPASKPDESFYYVDLSAVDQVEKRITGANEVIGGEAPSRARQLIRQGDVLVSTVRPNLNGVASVTKEFDGATASTGFCVLRPCAQRLASNYLMHWVRSPQFIEAMVREATGASYPAVSDKIIKSSQIPLPSFDEQQRIAAILDKADALRRTRKRALDLLDSLTQSIFLEMFGNLVGSKDYPRGTVADWVVDFDTGKNLAPDPDVRQTNGYRVLKVSSVTAGVFLPAEAKPLPAGYRPPDSHVVRKGDLLFSRANTAELIGATAYVEHSYDKLVLPDKIWRFVWCDTNAPHPRFVHALFSAPFFRRELSKRATGTSGSMKNISKGKVLEIEIALPNRTLQDQFAAKQQALQPISSATVRQSALLDDQFSSLQSQAFSGQL